MAGLGPTPRVRSDPCEVLPAHDNGPEEDPREKATAHTGADRAQAARGGQDAGRGIGARNIAASVSIIALQPERSRAGASSTSSRTALPRSPQRRARLRRATLGRGRRRARDALGAQGRSPAVAHDRRRRDELLVLLDAVPRVEPQPDVRRSSSVKAPRAPRGERAMTIRRTIVPVLADARGAHALERRPSRQARGHRYVPGLRKRPLTVRRQLLTRRSASCRWQGSELTIPAFRCGRSARAGEECAWPRAALIFLSPAVASVGGVKSSPSQTLARVQRCGGGAWHLHLRRRARTGLDAGRGPSNAGAMLCRLAGSEVSSKGRP